MNQCVDRMKIDDPAGDGGGKGKESEGEKNKLEFHTM